MLRLRPYKDTDAAVILSWCQDERSYYKWAAGKFGEYPVSEEQFGFVKSLMPFTAFDENGIVGFFTLRMPGQTTDELRFGFVIVDPEKRGRGYGKEMLRLGLKFAFEIFGAEKASLYVYENNPAAYYCYKSVGFRDVADSIPETYRVMNEEWTCRGLVLYKQP